MPRGWDPDHSYNGFSLPPVRPWLIKSPPDVTTFFSSVYIHCNTLDLFARLHCDSQQGKPHLTEVETGYYI